MDSMNYLDYVDPGYRTKDHELTCTYYLEHSKDIDFRWAAGAIAAESSIGTWTSLSTMKENIKELAARVYRLDKENNTIKVAYPPEVFEAGNMPQILSSITGNIYGLEELRRLRLLDVSFPRDLTEKFLGPNLGINEIKNRVGAKDRPLVGTIVKPKLGLNSEDHSKVAKKSWKNGLDIVKDDENLTSMQFNEFDERVVKTLEKKHLVEEKTGEKKLYFPNVTAPVSEMKRRADLVIENGGKYVMIDILTAGFSSLQEIRDYLEKKDRDIGIHAHRAQHAAYTRLKDHGISMLSIAKFARLVGVDNLHSGTVIGKMEGQESEVKRIYSFLRSDWYDKKTTIPVASGGLHPGLVPKVVELLGRDIVIQAGGGVHGHPSGTEAGSKALRDAADAVMEGISLNEKSKKSSELKKALNKWGPKKSN
ncbi:MAG: Ribulose 15-bisphosphate carboxylase large subunit RbcL [Candidatus Methanohalarchaeum thermophilum]|uniref:Ribulose bisphosphate carboxylase n=1 Tax=Methanohalarchaeum thermophilum TaxID=1903181 RepID=A0A1Q6DS44_METT1|nr:MAG: Ribulose 15-bisphosphate carboxylase large subunit RbcL [Candidatus Methanohalarchaeum thermophilum]